MAWVTGVLQDFVNDQTVLAISNKVLTMLMFIGRGKTRAKAYQIREVEQYESLELWFKQQAI